MILTLDQLERVATFRHVTSKSTKTDRPVTGGVYLLAGDSTLHVAGTDGYQFAHTVIEVRDGEVGELVVDPADLAAAAAAFRTRAPSDRGPVDVEATFLPDGIELVLGEPEQGSFFDDDDDTPPASYNVRRWTEARYPDWRKMIEKMPTRNVSKPLPVDPKRVAALAKTAGLDDEGDALILTLRTNTLYLRSSADPRWAAYLSAMTGITDDAT